MSKKLVVEEVGAETPADAAARKGAPTPPTPGNAPTAA